MAVALRNTELTVKNAYACNSGEKEVMDLKVQLGEMKDTQPRNLADVLLMYVDDFLRSGSAGNMGYIPIGTDESSFSSSFEAGDVEACRGHVKNFPQTGIDRSNGFLDTDRQGD